MVDKKQQVKEEAEAGAPELPLEDSQLALLGEGSAILPPGQTGRLVSDDGYEFSVAERLCMLEGADPAYGHHA